jgi:hypothetical protein
MEILVAEIKGRALRWVVAQALKLEVHNIDDLEWDDDQYWVFWKNDGTIRHAVEDQNNSSRNRRYFYTYYQPDVDHDQAAEIIDQYHISTVWDGSCWIASLYDYAGQSWYANQTSQNRLEASMRTFLWYKFGKTVDVPDGIPNE